MLRALPQSEHASLRMGGIWDVEQVAYLMGSLCVCRRMKRCSVVAWHPIISTQLVVGCADDLSPLLQIWDLRKNTMPMRELLGHEKVFVPNSCGLNCD